MLVACMWKGTGVHCTRFAIYSYVKVYDTCCTCCLNRQRICFHNGHTSTLYWVTPQPHWDRGVLPVQPDTWKQHTSITTGSEQECHYSGHQCDWAPPRHNLQSGLCGLQQYWSWGLFGGQHHSDYTWVTIVKICTYCIHMYGWIKKQKYIRMHTNTHTQTCTWTCAWAVNTTC